MESKFFVLERVADGAYAVIVKPGAGALGNAGFVDLGDEVLVFDTFLTPSAASDLRQAVDEVIGKPVKYVVNSHYHMDHAGGNQVFAGATVISTAITRDLILARNAVEDLETELAQFAEALAQMEQAALQETNERKRAAMLDDFHDKQVLHADMPGYRLTPPTVTFADRLMIHGSKRSVELITYGGGHTESDSFLYLADEGLAFMADLVLVQETPFMGVGNPEEWLTILGRVKELGLQTIIPGHGKVGTAAHIEETEAYIRFVQKTLRDAKAQGRSVDETVTAPLPAPYNEWGSSMVYEWNIRRLWDR